jgi:glutamate/tyrosine decarboxylase-like PLP-dependent enzyme
MDAANGVSAALRRQAGDRALFTQVLEYALDYMQTVDEREVYPSPQAIAGLAAFAADLPAQPGDPREIIELLHRAGSPATVAQTGGRYFGFVNGGVVPAALAAKWLADTWDQNAALYVISPVASVLESLCEGWLVSLLGLPPGSAAGFVSGTSTATLCGLAAGRDTLLRRQGWDADDRGLFGAPEIRVLLGAQAHSTVYKALSILGLGKARVTLLPADDQGRVIPEGVPALDDRTLLVLQAGNVNTGAFDPFAAICGPARAAGAWVHVDGAFGLWAAASERRRELTDGVHLADSWSADAHKTLNAPYDNGIVFCRHREALARAMHMTGSYIVYSRERDGMRYTPDMSRRARGVEIWATLKALGRRGVGELVDDLCDKALALAAGLESQGFAVRNRVCFNQVLAACASPALTEATLAALQASGECWCGGAVWAGEPVIRLSVCSYATTAEDIQRSVRAAAHAREQAARTLQGRTTTAPGPIAGGAQPHRETTS